MSLPLLPEQVEIELSFEQELSESLGELDFAEALPESASPEQLNKIAPALIRYLLSSGDRGYKDGIDSVTDEAGNPPSQDNNWLYDTDKNAYVGRFTDLQPGDDRVFAFRIERQGNEWVRSFQPIAGVED